MQRSTKTTWTQKRENPFPQLESDLHADIVIVGGGITGITTAYILAEAGLKPVLIESAHIGHDVTTQTTAFITQAIDTDLSELVAMYGKDKAQLVWQSGATAIDEIERIIKLESIDCEFMRCPVSTYARTKEEWRNLEEEIKTIHELGFKATIQKENDLGFPSVGYIELPAQAKFHPLKYLEGLTDAAVRKGVKIFETTKMHRLTGSGPLIVDTHKAKITTDWVIIASHYPPGNQGVTRFKKGLYKSYVIEAEIPAGTIKEGLYLDMAAPYHYLRIDSGIEHDLLILGGEDHRNELPLNEEKGFKALEKYLREDLWIKNANIVRRWIGPMLEPSDGLPLIGEMSKHKLVATAFSGNGMTYSMIAALLLRDTIKSKDNPWSKVYDPMRLPSLKQMLYKGRDYTRILFGGAIKNLFTRH